MRQTGCGVAVVPVGPWNNRVGACPTVKLLQNNVPVAISTDGAAPYFVSDLFLQLHRAMMLQWFENRDMTIMPTGRLVRMATIEAAALLGIADEVGSLETGKKADIILIDLEQPHLVPFADPANMIAWYVRGNDVDTVLVDGQIVVEGRQVLTVDEKVVLSQAREEIERSFERYDVHPYLDHGPGFWDGWQEETG
jgi:cytosine/adenosine deaminase-related metal-dependent hydrolase